MELEFKLIDMVNLKTGIIYIYLVTNNFKDNTIKFVLKPKES